MGPFLVELGKVNGPNRVVALVAPGADNARCGLMGASLGRTAP